MQYTCYMGLFTAITRAWLTIDNLLFFWNYEDGYVLVLCACFQSTSSENDASTFVVCFFKKFKEATFVSTTT